MPSDSTLYFTYVAQGTQIRSAGKRFLACAIIVFAGALAVLGAKPATDSPIRAAAVVIDKAPEPATFALIGGALCLVSLRLRRRQK